MRKINSFSIKIIKLLLIIPLILSNIQFKIFQINSKLKQLDWCGENKQISFVLTEQNSIFKLAKNGLDFENLDDNLIKIAKKYNYKMNSIDSTINKNSTNNTKITIEVSTNN